MSSPHLTRFSILRIVCSTGGTRGLAWGRGRSPEHRMFRGHHLGAPMQGALSCLPPCLPQRSVDPGAQPGLAMASLTPSLNGHVARGGFVCQGLHWPARLLPTGLSCCVGSMNLMHPMCMSSMALAAWAGLAWWVLLTLRHAPTPGRECPGWQKKKQCCWGSRRLFENAGRHIGQVGEVACVCPCVQTAAGDMSFAVLYIGRWRDENITRSRSNSLQLAISM